MTVSLDKAPAPVTTDAAAEAAPAPRVKRKYTVTADRPKNKPNTSALALRQVSNQNRITGTMTTVYDLQNVSDDEPEFVQAPTDGSEDRWLVACHDHEFSTTFHTLLVARRIAFLPPLWCADCADDVPLDEFMTPEEIAATREYAPQH